MEGRRVKEGTREGNETVKGEGKVGERNGGERGSGGRRG